MKCFVFAGTGLYRCVWAYGKINVNFLNRILPHGRFGVLVVLTA